jgi:hypothetical protein
MVLLQRFLGVKRTADRTHRQAVESIRTPTVRRRVRTVNIDGRVHVRTGPEE